jgi:type II secretory pathway component PulF
MAGGNSNISLRLSVFDRVTANDKAFIARQLSVMLESGLPLVQAVQSLANQTQNSIIKRTLTEVASNLENGYSFSESIKRYPKIFNTVFVAVVAAGETSGKLDTCMHLLADELERDSGFRGRVIGSMLYPGFIIIAMVVVGIILTTKIVPALELVFADSNAQLPWTTEVVIHITNSLIDYWYLYIAAVVLIVVGISRLLANDDGRRAFNNLIMAIPVVGKLFTDLEMARLTRILGILVQSGVPIIQALNSVALVMDSVVYRDILQATAQDVERGAPIAQTMAKYPKMPSTVTEMIGVGEKTGKLDQVLNKLAEFYETETDQATKNFSAIIEPVIFVIVGLGVAFIVFSIIIPIYSLSSVIQ